MFVAGGDRFLVHYTDLDQPGMVDAFSALVDEKIIAIVETGISRPFTNSAHLSVMP